MRKPARFSKVAKRRISNKSKQAARGRAPHELRTPWLRDVLICAFLIGANLFIYLQVSSHEFISLDDDLYVVNNGAVHGGLSWSSVVWAFTTFHATNWHPLTWLSHALDCQLFGLQAGGHHVTNLVLHCLNSLLAFFVFRRLTNATWKSAFVAALFAVHPLHVESVAWIAERKDVLSTSFWLLGMFTYTRYAENVNDRKWFLLTFASLALGLMAKPMLVTLPLVFLLIDYWPLHRLDWQPADGLSRLPAPILPLLREKLPFFALVVLSSVVTFVAQRSGGAVQELQNVPVVYRLGNSLVAYVSYVLALFWPARLGVYYPFPQGGRPLWQVIAAAATLVGISVVVWRNANKRGYLLFGWLWFLGTLVPVIGLVQVGSQSMADRYTYIPYFGLFVIIAWCAGEIFDQLHWSHSGTAAIAIAPVLILSFISWRQVKFWHDSTALFEHTLSVTNDNLAIEYNLGVVLGQQGHPDQAATHFAKALELWPEFYDALFNMGVSLAAQGHPDQAVPYYNKALSVQPDSADTRVNLAVALAQQEKLNEAKGVLEEAEQLDPNNAAAHTNLGLVLLRQNKLTEATAQLQRAIELNPASAEAHNNLGLALLAQGNTAAATNAFQRAVQLNPDYAPARNNLRRAQAAEGEKAK